MKKLILLFLLSFLLLVLLVGCNNRKIPDGTNESTPHGTSADTTTPENDQHDLPEIEGALDKNSDLIVTLVAYLKQYWVEYDMIGKSFADKIDDIKGGAQPLHVVFNPSDYYFVCAYYNPTHEYDEGMYCCAEQYTWMKYESAAEIKEYCNDIKFVVAFQINKALSVTNILSQETAVPDMEHFQIYKPLFEGGTNKDAPITFDQNFLYLNNADKATIYHCKAIYNHEYITIPCSYIDGQYYLSFFLYTIYSDGRKGEESDYVYSFGEYYDALMSVMEKDKYHVTDKYERTRFYGVISFDDFVHSTIVRSDDNNR